MYVSLRELTMAGVPIGMEDGRRNGFRRTVAGGLVAALTAAAALGWSPVAGAVGTVDQQQTSTEGGATPVSPTEALAQTFTAGRSGRLDRVDLFLGDPGSDPATPLTVELRTTAAAAPNGPAGDVLASTTVPGSAVPANTSAAFVGVTFATAPQVTAGQRYAIVAHTSGMALYFWFRGGADPYPNGALFGASSPSGPWTAFPTDAAFRTYVESAPATGGTTTGGGGSPAPTGTGSACPPGNSPGVQCFPRPGGGLTILGTAGNDTMVGADGPDVMSGLGGNDRMSGSFGDDRAFGSAGDDTLLGEDGNDHLSAGDGADRIYATRGNDTLAGGRGDDLMVGGDGNDRMLASSGDDRGYGNAGDDTLDGGAQDDRLVGGSDDDALSGGDADDRLFGLGGADRLDGDRGADQLSGGDGNDRLDGGTQLDRFVPGRGLDRVDSRDGLGGETIACVSFLSSLRSDPADRPERDCFPRALP